MLRITFDIKIIYGNMTFSDYSAIKYYTELSCRHDAF